MPEKLLLIPVIRTATGSIGVTSDSDEWSRAPRGALDRAWLTYCAAASCSA